MTVLSMRSQRKEVFDSLPKRQRDVLNCLRRGLTDKQIMAELGIGKSTVNGHIRKLFRKFGVNKRDYFQFQLEEDISEKR